MKKNLRHFLQALGPGIVFAGMCIGVSHLVQSTRAGADYGFQLLLAVLAANLFKYPFFEFASRYTAATGVSILDGYAKMGKWILWLYAGITVITMFIVTAAVTFVAAGLLGNLMPLSLDTNMWAAIIMGFCILTLASGKYSALDGLLKVVSIILLISTVIAFISAITKGPAPLAEGFVPPDVMTPAGIIFAVALMGWMPTAVDLSTWTGLWAEARMQQTGYRPLLRETLLDFNIGYLMSTLLAVVFLSLGALVIYGSGTELSNSAPEFAGQLIGMYTESIGAWSYYIIAVAAFSTMFSTSITVLDGYGRVMTRLTEILSGRKSKRQYSIWVIVVALGGFFVVSQFLGNLKQLVDIATILSFLVAPAAAYINYRAIFSKEIRAEFRPPRWLTILAVGGLIFLSVFTIIYLYVLLVL